MTITEATTVAEIAAALPASVRVFQRHDIDFCCGGKKPLGEVCTDRGLQFDAVRDEIVTSAAGEPAANRDWRVAPLTELTAHIVRAYHDPLRDELPRLGAMATKVARTHFAKDERLIQIAAIVSEISDELLQHMQKEERILFPAIDAIETSKTASVRLDGPISVMEYEHDHAGALLAELRSLTDGYQPPQWGCATLRALFAGLSELESSMHVHVHLENNVLFPRAQQRLRPMQASA
jgi:regulator of cell morphogenesis and NO signaling